jgi:hypothetical protein
LNLHGPRPVKRCEVNAEHRREKDCAPYDSSSHCRDSKTPHPPVIKY